MKNKLSNSWGEFYDKKYKKSDLLWFTRSYPKYFDYILDSGAKTILEVGVGSGMHTILLSLLGFDIIGIDNNEKILKIVEENNKKFGGKAKFFKMDAFNLDFSPKAFDLVISEGFFEHFGDEEVIKLLKEQLKIGKEVIISIPTIGYPNKDYGNERLLTKENWIEIIKKAFSSKVKIVKIQYDGLRRDIICHSYCQGSFKFLFSPWRWRYKPRLLIIIKET